MKNFYLEKTSKTPKISLDGITGKFIISGRSIPENSLEFYKPVYDWLDEYKSEPQDTTFVEVSLEYFNTSSSKCIVEILRRVESLTEVGSRVIVKWYYDEEDEDMKEAGLDFQEIIKIPIELEMIEEE
ncbi:uncharacterized protein DUF1987 [Sediminitomix flava]|uniref:Uncharacterized protein DUF1987 n=2 Tax=Sediminitomix flava TaxID=379075 RepID=A0A315ZAA4_SEDFL|nr:uncharacterized protein DUF1987 [Sediminitomix flava]